MKIITVGSNLYLGEIETDGTVTTLKNALPLNGANVTKEDLANYLKADNAGTLEKDITIRGANAVFSERDLSDDMNDELTILVARFAKAKKTALPGLVNRTFDSIR